MTQGWRLYRSPWATPNTHQRGPGVLTELLSHAASPSLRRVSEMPHPLSAGLQPLSQRVVLGATPARAVRRMDLVLFVLEPACIQPVGVGGIENLRSLQPGASPSFWPAARNLGHKSAAPLETLHMDVGAKDRSYCTSGRPTFFTNST